MVRTLLLTAVALVACRHAYRAEVTLLGDGGYMIRAAPEDDPRSETIAAQAAHRRAAEVCPGGYTLIDNKIGSAQTTETVAVFGRRTVEFPEVTLIVRCTP